METKHTPGPWRIGTPGPNGCYTIGTVRGLMTAMIAHSRNEPDQAIEAEANARLIAAAPCLLEALQALEQIKDIWLPQEAEEGFAEEMYMLHKARNNMLAAIAKATA